MKNKKFKMELSEQVQAMPPSGIRAFFDLVLGMKDVVSLGVGEPDFVTPWAFREAAIYAIEHGFTSYTSNQGMIELRRVIAGFLETRHKIKYKPETDIIITVGVSEGLDIALRAILNPGDEVLIPEPCYVSYQPLTNLAGGVAVPVSTSAATGFKVTAAMLEKASTARTKALLINYPSNPTGASYSREEMAKIAAFARKRKLIVLSDEIYDELTYEGKHIALPAFPGMREQTVYFNGFSKAYAMTGWRIGYACGPAPVIAAMTKIHQYSMLCAPIMGQFAAMEALKSGLKPMIEMREEYRRRRNFMAAELNRMGLTCLKPAGAFYLFPSITKTGLSSMDFSTRLLEKEKVAVVPGTAFGPSFDGHIRISYATAFEDLREAAKRMERFVKSLR